jgi:hypothetical protein
MFCAKITFATVGGAGGTSLMDNAVTVDQAIGAAIAAERAVEALFRGLEAKFAPYADLAEFWQEYRIPLFIL